MQKIAENEQNVLMNAHCKLRCGRTCVEANILQHTTVQLVKRLGGRVVILVFPEIFYPSSNWALRSSNSHTLRRGTARASLARQAANGACQNSLAIVSFT